MSARWVTLLLWAAVAASGVAWAFKLFVVSAPAPREARVADAGAAMRGDVTRVLGVDAAPPAPEAEPAPAAAARFQLIGVVAPRGRHPVREGVALIAVDGKLPKAFRIGAPVDGTTVLKSVRARGADIGPRDGATTMALELPPLPSPATGTLPAAGAAPVPATAPARPVTPPGTLRPRGMAGGVPQPLSAPVPPSNAIAPPPVPTSSQAVPPPAATGEAQQQR